MEIFLKKMNLATVNVFGDLDTLIKKGGDSMLVDPEQSGDNSIE